MSPNPRASGRAAEIGTDGRCAIDRRIAPRGRDLGMNRDGFGFPVDCDGA